ncbi:MAG: T9SS type A sorting domain-containing protein [bacterium]
MFNKHVFSFSLSAILLISFCSGENWPGMHKTGTRINSSNTTLEGSLSLDWIYNIDPQKLNYGLEFKGSLRSKNLAIRDGKVAVLLPFQNTQYFGFIDAGTGILSDSFATNLYQTTYAEFNHSGVEGRDTRNGQFIVYWHANGNIYGKSGGDRGSSQGLKVSDGTEVISIIDKNAYNVTSYFVMNDNCNWYFNTMGGHSGFPLAWNTVRIGPLYGTTSAGQIVLNNGTGSFFTWCGPFLLDSNKFYSVGATHHPDLGESETIYESGRRDWLGAQVRAYTIVGQDVYNTNHMKFAGGSTPDWMWEKVDAFVGNDGDLCSAPKAFCMSDSEIYLITQNSVTHTAADATVDFTDSLVLNGFLRSDGTHWDMKLGITSAGCTMSKSYGYSLSYSTFFPQIAYTDRTGSGGSQLVAVMLPDALHGNGWLNPTFSPYNSSPAQNTRISVVDVMAKSELWNYEYPHNVTTPVWNFACNTNTKMLIAGDNLYVFYVKTATNLARYIDTVNAFDLTLYVDQFKLSDGTKTSFTADLGVKANTIQVDDAAAVDGKLFVLVTYREWSQASTESGGAQLVACLIGESATSVDKNTNLDGRNLNILTESNPANGKISFKISGNVEKIENITLEIYDIKGILIDRIAENNINKTVHRRIFWDTSNKSAGIYILKADAGNFLITKKITLLR